MPELDLYQYLTELVIQEINGSGAEKLIEVLQTPDIPVDQANELASVVFTELLMAFQDGRLDAPSIISFLQVSITDDEKATVFAQVFDAFPLTDAFKDLLVRISDSNTIQPATYAQHINCDSIILAGIVPKNMLYRQLNTRKRDEFYTQNKFNLLHEEFEGYSKLINEFYLIMKNKENDFQVEYAVSVVEQMIGHYQLDPNRVLDVLLDIFSNTIVGSHIFMLNFLKQSRWWPDTEADCISGLESLSIGGSDHAAKLIGLKVIKQSPDRELSGTFKIMVAILIKEGFLSFGSIVKYFSKSEKAMANLESRYKKELEEQAFRASASALALAAPLADEDVEEPTTQASVSNRQSVPFQTMVKYNLDFQLLKVCLGNGLYWPSIYILSNHPFLAHVDPEVETLITRLMGAIIEPFYSQIIQHSQEEPKDLESFLHSGQSNNVTIDEDSNQKLYCFNPIAKSFKDKILIYFYTEWDTGIPTVSKADDLITVSRQFIKFLGVQLASDLSLFQKICEIVVVDLKRDNGTENKEKWLVYFRNFILPAICAIEDNPIPVDKAYEILKFYDLNARFNLYGELYQVLAKNNPYVKIHTGKAEKSTKDVLKRLSKENIDEMKTQLAKISYANPLPCFLTILQQIESYDNLNSLVVETAGFFSEYGWDNMTLAILMRLTTPGRTNIQTDGMNERQWIQSLASFIGKICQKYPESMNLSTIVLFLIKLFHAKEITGLIVLKEILQSMGGIQAITNLTPLQINMINCGSCMEKIVYHTIGDNRYENAKSGSLLCKTFFDLNAVNELLVLLCQANRNIVSGEEFSHLKALANKNDEVDAVTHLLGTLVSFFGDKNAVSNLMPIGMLVERFEVPVPWAFEIWRRYLDDELLYQVQHALESYSPETFSSLSSNLFATFWKLGLFDLNYSSELYDNELDKLQGNVTSLKENISFSKIDKGVSKRDKEVSKSALQKLTADLLRTEEFIAEIPEQKIHHEENDKKVVNAIKQVNSSWFQEDSQQSITKFVEVCVLPRAVHSSFDALFSAKFLFFLQKLRTDNYSVLNALNIIFSRRVLFGTLFTCTPTEAENLGLFVAEVLKELNFWTDETVFNKMVEDSPLVESLEPVSFSSYRTIVYKFHSEILEDITEALLVIDYMSRRNAITFLKNLLEVYPTVEDHCELLIELIADISKRETRDDLKLSSNALIGHVKSRQGSWVHVWDFVDLPAEEKEANMLRRQKIADKRRREAEKIKQAELKKRQGEEEQRQKVLAEKEKQRQEQLEREKVVQNQQASASALNYNETAVTTERPLLRGQESVRGRYDQYSTKKEDLVVPSSKDFKVSQPKPTSNGKLADQKDKLDVHDKSDLKDKVNLNNKLDLKVAPDVKVKSEVNVKPVKVKVDPKVEVGLNIKLDQKDIPASKPRDSEAGVMKRVPSGPMASNPSRGSGSLASGPVSSGAVRSRTVYARSLPASSTLVTPKPDSQSMSKALQSVLSNPVSTSGSRQTGQSGTSQRQTKQPPPRVPVPPPRTPAPQGPARQSDVRRPENSKSAVDVTPSTSNSKRVPLPPQQAPRDSRSGYRNDWNDRSGRNENWGKNNSHSRSESHGRHESHGRNDNQGRGASQAKNDNQGRGASQEKNESHGRNASPAKNESRGRNSNLTKSESHGANESLGRNDRNDRHKRERGWNEGRTDRNDGYSRNDRNGPGRYNRIHQGASTTPLPPPSLPPPSKTDSHDKRNPDRHDNKRRKY